MARSSRTVSKTPSTRTVSRPPSRGMPAFGPIIGLVFMTLVAGAGWTAWFMQRNETKKSDDTATKAEAKYTETDRQYKNAQFAVLHMQQKYGLPLNDAEKFRYEQLKEEFDKLAQTGKGDVRQEDWFKRMEEVWKRDLAARPASPELKLLGDVDLAAANDYPQRAAQLAKLADDRTKWVLDREGLLKTLRAEYAEYQRKFNAKVEDEKLAAQRQQLEEEAFNKLAKADAAIRGRLEQLQVTVTTNLNEIIAQEKKKWDDERKKLHAEYEEKMERLAKEEKALEQKAIAATRVKNITIDGVKGEIIRVEPNGEQVYINIGSEDHVRPNLTFSVYKKGPGGRAEGEAIVMIRVTSVVGPKLSLATVTHAAKPVQMRRKLDQYGQDVVVTPEDRGYWATLIDSPVLFHQIMGRSPISTGDLLYNPVWSPKKPVRIALAGMFDLNGDGIDDGEVLRKILTDMGAEIDAYLDLKDMEIKGRIDFQTNYLIVNVPTFTDAFGTQLRDKRLAELREELEKKATEMQDIAAKKGAEVVNSVGAFLVRMGYSPDHIPTPKNIGAARGNAAPGNGAAPPAAPPMKEKEDKPMPAPK